MRNLHRVVAIIEQRKMRQAALERALALYQASCRTRAKSDIKIVALMPIFDFSFEGRLSSKMSLDQIEQNKSALIKKHKKWLENYLSIHAMGFDIECHVICSKFPGRDIISYARERCADIIIKTADVHGLLDSVLFTPLDLQLLRHSSIPVLIARDRIWHPTGVIAVALQMADPSDVKTRKLNMRLLREAQELSQITKCKIHLLNAIPPVLPPASIALPGFVPESLGDETLKEGCRALLTFAKRHRIMGEYCHIREGHPEDVIPALCDELKPTALFIGTAARDGLAVALLGNICEKVIDTLECDVAVITPKAVEHKQEISDLNTQ